MCEKNLYTSSYKKAISSYGREMSVAMAAVAVMPQFEQELWPLVNGLNPNPEEEIFTTDDSGISTDDNLPFTSSEEENHNSDEISKDESPRRKRYPNYIERADAIAQPRCNRRNHDDSFDSENGRLSPPLQEVELTASDEDDDGSVLELVIPMQSRYKRVPTSSPKKSKKRSIKKILCGFLCCGRGRK